MTTTPRRERLGEVLGGTERKTMSDFDNNIPGGAWLEYDAAADWCAARGIKGGIRDPLPGNLSGRAMELISIDPEAFASRVREHAYMRSMTGNRQVTIIKSGESE